MPSHHTNIAWEPFDWFLLRGTGLPFEWIARLGDTPAMETEDEEGYCRRLDEARRRLWRCIGHPAVVDALLLSSPTLSRNLKGWEQRFVVITQSSKDRRSKDRRREQTLLRYLQRFTSKNDSTSFFGPVAAGRFDKVETKKTHATLARKRAFATQWVVQKILDRACAALTEANSAVEQYWRAPGVRVGGGLERLTLSEQGTFEISRFGPAIDATRLLHATAEPLSRQHLIRILAEDCHLNPDEAGSWIDALEDAGFLMGWSALPSGLEDPIGIAVQRLSQQPEHPLRALWLQRLHWFAKQVQSFGASDFSERQSLFASVEQTLSDWLSGPVLRRGGQYNASRTFIHEMADRTGEVVGLPDGWSSVLRRSVSDYLTLCLIPKMAARHRFAHWFRAAYQRTDRPRLWREVFDNRNRDWLSYDTKPDEKSAALKSVMGAIADQFWIQLVAHSKSKSVASLHIDPAPILERLASVADLLEGPGTAYANPDIAIALSGNRPVPVLAESHHMPTLTGYLLLALAHRAQIEADIRAFLTDLCQPAAPAFIWSYQRSFINVFQDIGATAIELSGSAPLPPARRVSFAELEVRLENGAFCFAAPNYSGQRLEVAPLSRLSGLDSASSVFPLWCPQFYDLIGHKRLEQVNQLPRVMFGQLVIGRRQWFVPTSVWTDARTPRAALKRLDHHCKGELPRCTFARANSEPKPIFYDWSNPLFVEMAFSRFRRDRTIVLEEMLPAPEHLWLESELGTHTSEMRTVFVRRTKDSNDER